MPGKSKSKWPTKASGSSNSNSNSNLISLSGGNANKSDTIKHNTRQNKRKRYSGTPRGMSFDERMKYLNEQLKSFPVIGPVTNPHKRHQEINDVRTLNHEMVNSDVGREVLEMLDQHGVVMPVNGDGTIMLVAHRMDPGLENFFDLELAVRSPLYRIKKKFTESGKVRGSVTYCHIVCCGCGASFFNQSGLKGHYGFNPGNRCISLINQMENYTLHDYENPKSQSYVECDGCGNKWPHITVGSKPWINHSLKCPHQVKAPEKESPETETESESEPEAEPEPEPEFESDLDLDSEQELELPQSRRKATRKAPKRRRLTEQTSRSESESSSESESEDDQTTTTTTSERRRQPMSRRNFMLAREHQAERNNVVQQRRALNEDIMHRRNLFRTVRMIVSQSHEIMEQNKKILDMLKIHLDSDLIRDPYSE